jgi:VanZ family protein
LHATVFLFCPLFWADWLNKRWGYVLLVAVLTGLFTELVQALLPYRGYDVNDLIANCVGIFLGWLAILPVMIRHRRIMRNRAA